MTERGGVALGLFCLFLFILTVEEICVCSEADRRRGPQAWVCTRGRQRDVGGWFLEEAGRKDGAPQPAGHLLPLSLQGENWCGEAVYEYMSLASIFSMNWHGGTPLGSGGVEAHRA